MTTLAEIEAAASGLPQDQQRVLLQWLVEQMHAGTVAPGGHGVLDIPPVSLGKVIRWPDQEDDLLAEMLEGRG